MRQGFASYVAALPEDQRKAKQAEIEQALRGMGVEFLTEEEWNNDPELKRAMPFEPFMTRERARAKAELFDAMQERIDQIGHAPDDPFIRAAGKTLGFVSDPTNIVPLGMAARQIFNIARIGIPSVLRAIGSGEAANVLKTQVGRIALDSLKTGAVASAKTAASESLTKPWREEWGEEVPWSQIGIDSLMAGFTGLGLGMMGGFGSRITRAPAGGASGGGSAALPPKPPASAAAPTSSSTGQAGSVGVPPTAKLPSISKVEKDIGGFGSPNPPTLFHYTNEKGLRGILASQKLNPSLKSKRPSDVRYGNGQYLTDIVPGTLPPDKLSVALVHNPYEWHRFTHFVEIDPSGLNVIRGRPNVFVIPNEFPLDLYGRIVRHGAH